MSAPDARLAATAAGTPRAFVALGRHWPWLALLALAVLVPWGFFDWSKGRHSGFVVSLLSQMGMMVVFSLSYNMLMGQSGLLSFGHAVFFGLAGYVTAHAMNAIKLGAFWLPQELLPVVGGGTGLLFGVFFGYMVTKQRATAFAMITLGLGELVTAAAVMFVGFFGGEGGVTTNRMLETSLFGLSYGPSIQVYYLILAWTAISVAAMLLLTRTPLGRMANACRDNHERAQFVGYDPRMVRFYQFALAGGFAGIAGSLYAITYEIVTYDAANAVMSGNALLMTFIGGVGAFWGPIVGAVLITLLQSWMSLLSNAWLIYVGVLFIVMVIYAPGGIAGLVLAHRPIWQAGRLGALTLPYLRIVPPGLAMLIGFVGLVELCTFVTIGAGQGKALVLFQRELDTGSYGPWLVAAALFAGGGGLLLRESRIFVAAWNAVGEEIKAKEALQ
jgi:branched-chain amino acid transport system permease protein